MPTKIILKNNPVKPINETLKQPRSKLASSETLAEPSSTTYQN